MPKETFYNLPQAKQQLVLEAVRQEFEEHPIFEASVKNIVTSLGIARGSFYTYFKDLEESYFTILERDTIEIHDLFLTVFREHNQEIFPALTAFGEKMAQELFKKDRYALYKNRYLYWTADLDRLWRQYREEAPGRGAQEEEADPGTDEMMQFIKALVHDLVRRLFAEAWDSKTFLKHYSYHLYLMEHGVRAAMEHKGETYGNH